MGVQKLLVKTSKGFTRARRNGAFPAGKSQRDEISSIWIKHATIRYLNSLQLRNFFGFPFAESYFKFSKLPNYGGPKTI